MRFVHANNAKLVKIPSKVKEKVCCNPVILTHRRAWHQVAFVIVGFKNHAYQTFGLRSSVESSGIQRPNKLLQHPRKKRSSHRSFTS
ncbi:hypothetical protein B9Q01_08685 [Candidatus Marsarchaeota G1 archaeon OSP_D]|uniref:Uncharacterized protein n=3 Tax=Candidatus Marsarchaeota group 1 TaxID=2203770 RepID=A0A2R6ABW0_9ARCH|nr:MAG: hypothetical protein B9Q01_08685 [Candidatus Marsarchaeota G1 archaeon OSP_D]PSN83828.1 MAG: hypothetical protein B9Q02_10130 [Candidatus Marsarchaeota G1 archaeon BE_D]PSN87011.1 MAG: hypothetical protein B9Q00_09965 [Candidatus Marsarchaeota G1 archaeon OSP_C]